MRSVSSREGVASPCIDVAVVCFCPTWQCDLLEGRIRKPDQALHGDIACLKSASCGDHHGQIIVARVGLHGGDFKRERPFVSLGLPEQHDGDAD